MRGWFLTLVLLSVCGSLLGECPEGFYSRLEGKSGVELKNAVREVCLPDSFVSIVFGEGHTSFKTWQAFETSDVREIDGKKIWWDMYSNNIVYVESGNKSLNIEHSVANSWWGGKTGNLQAYQDLHHLNPSNSDANGKKSNWPLGVTVATPAFDNGMTRVGKPLSGFGGNSTTVFEPADEYKGDFARAYFYIFSAYPDIAWRTDKGGENMYDIVEGKAMLKPWATEMLLKWNADDPVDSKEIVRNEEIFKCQKNRNPYIDMPELAEYIWGARNSEKFHVMNPTVATDRPAAPRPSGLWMTGVNNYTGRYWDSTRIEFDCGENELWISLDGGGYERYGGAIKLPAAKAHGAESTVKAYCLKTENGKELKSSVTTVSMAGKDLNQKDYSIAEYDPVVYGNGLKPEGRYILLSALTNHVMGINGTSFMPDCWFAYMDGERVREVPLQSALFAFEPTSQSGQYLIMMMDMGGNAKGYWNANGSNKMKIDPSQGTPCTVTVREDGTADIRFTANGSLQYNQTQPRFLNYSSAQGDVKLYEFRNFINGFSEVEVVSDIDNRGYGFWVSQGGIEFSNGGKVYNLSGLEVNGDNLPKGIYIILLPDGKSAKVNLQ